MEMEARKKEGRKLYGWKLLLEILNAHIMKQLKNRETVKVAILCWCHSYYYYPVSN